MAWWRSLPLFCALASVHARGEPTKMETEVNLASFLRGIYGGLEPSVHNTDFKTEPVQETDASGPVVMTKDGPVQGMTVDQAHIFYGIPYADPPVGAYRWKPPRAVSPWKALYDATFPRSPCVQGCRGPMAAECPKNVSEDCLYLNVFVPRELKSGSPPSGTLPVMAWIHGGDFIAGSASKPLYDGRFIANFTRTIVVSLEYRLGAFGFLVSGKDAEKSAALGNYGILDQQAALLWVQRNIQMFGGDSGKVTLFGESAGAQSVGLHLAIQSSKDLFKQAVLQSLPFSIPFKSRHDALKLGKDFARKANCSVGDVVCLMSLSPRAVLEAQMKTSSQLVNPFRFLEVFETWGPFVDGELIQEQALAAFQAGRWHTEKPVLLGTTSEEGVIFAYGVFNKPVSAVESVMYVTAIFKQHSLRVLRQYLPLYRDSDRRNMLAQIVTDFVFLCPARRSARAATRAGGKTWMYVFDHVTSDPRVWSGLTFCYAHVCHGAELPFVFDSAPVAGLAVTPGEKRLSDRMLCYWGAFAHAGDPSSRLGQTTFCRERGAPVWPRYSDAGGWPLMNLTLGSHAQEGTRNAVCNFWDSLGIY